MKKNLLCLSLLTALTGCGQLGPLYLPDAPPPIHVAPEPEPAKPEIKPETKTLTNPPSQPEKTK